MLTNFINNMLEFAIVIIDLLIWGTGIAAGVKYLVRFREQNEYDENVWKAMAIRGAIILGVIIVIVCIVNAILNGFKIR